MEVKYETIDPDSNSSFRAAFFENWSMDEHPGWHHHIECEFSFMVSGRGTLFVGDGIKPIAPGDLAMIGPDIPHSFSQDESDDSQFDSIVIQFDPKMLEVPGTALPELAECIALVERAKRGLVFAIAPGSEAETLLKEIVQSDGLRRLTALMRLLDDLSQREDALTLVSDSYQFRSKEFSTERMSYIMNYIKDNLDQDIVQSDVAAELDMKPASFSRFFKNATGRTFVSFVNRIRTAEACRLLAATEDEITQIAFSCGYANISNFNRHFRDIWGMTPSEYRRQHLRSQLRTSQA
jgi:AraC-like DNA-binding protein